MKTTLRPIVLATAVALAAPMAAQADLSANAAVTSNYIWRGMTQTGDEAAVSGGVDYSNSSGFYAGTWASNLGGGDYELDFYGGYGGEISGFGYDVGAITYRYPVSSTNFSELYFNGTFQMISFGLAYTFGSDDNTTVEYSKGDLYYYAGAEFEVRKGLTLGVTAGHYSYDDAGGDDFNHFQASLSKGDFTLAVDKNGRTAGTEDKVRVSVSWSKDFDL